MKKESGNFQRGIFQRTLDGLFRSRVVSFFQSRSGYTPMEDGYELDGVRIVRDGVVTLCVVDIGGGSLALVDAGYDRTGAAVLRELGRRGAGVDAVKAVLLTHGHIDHIGAASLFPDAEVMALSEDVDLAEGRARSRGALSGLLPANDTGVKVTRNLSDGESFGLGGRSVRVFAVPGHTPGSAAFLIDDILFLGDSAFSGRDGRIIAASRPFTDDFKQSRRSVGMLAARLEREKLPVKALFFAHSGPDVRGLAPLLEFAERGD